MRNASLFNNPEKITDLNSLLEKDQVKPKAPTKSTGNIYKQKKRSLSPFPMRKIMRRIDQLPPTGSPERLLPSLSVFEDQKSPNKTSRDVEKAEMDTKVRCKSQPILRKIANNEDFPQM